MTPPHAKAERGAGYSILHSDQCERSGAWSLVRRSLGVESFGINLVEIAPGDAIPGHDETARDQEELFVVLEGEPVVEIDGIEHPAPAGTFARLDPEPHRRVVNPGRAPARVLIVSAPRTSGYEPMDWA
jgi:uncharacterized cupin superfamily protein